VSDPTALTGLSWFWIAAAATVPLAAGLLAAWPIWLTGQPILGNIAGSIIVFGAAVGLIMREHTELDRLVQACIAEGTTCWPTPSAFTRFAIYAFIALAQVIALFTLSISVETRLRRQHYAPEWR
jgi:ethanolamine transporter EutH